MVERVSLLQLLKDRRVIFGAILFILLVAASYLIHPGGFFLRYAHSTTEIKSLLGFFSAVAALFLPFIRSEPFFAVWTLIGLIFLFKNERRMFSATLLFVGAYVLIFYLLFHIDDRFIAYQIPLFALVSGYGAAAVWHRLKNLRFIRITLFSITLVGMVIPTIRVDTLLLKNDTRAQAREWMESNLPQGAKILVLSPQTRLSATPTAIREQKDIDPQSLRSVDEAEAVLDPSLLKHKAFHALNLYTLRADHPFFENVATYRKEKKYEYAVLAQSIYGESPVKEKALASLVGDGVLIARFPGFDRPGFELTEGAIGSLSNLFSGAASGPTVSIYRYEL